MTSPFLPAGRYLVAFNQVRTVAGGQTHSMLQRTWLFAQDAGVGSTILSFDPYPDYTVVESDLRQRGKLHPDVALVNIYDYYRDHPWQATSSQAPLLRDLHHLRPAAEHREDGSLWRTRYDDPVDDEPVYYDYHRRDGSTFLRTPLVSLDEFQEQPGLVESVDGEGTVVATHPTLGDWFASWVHELTTDDEEVFLFYDSMMLPPHLSPRLRTEIHQIAMMHMAHVYDPRQWNSPQHPPARRSLEQLHHFDAFVILTERQREDVELYYGQRSNLFVLPNPGETVPAPDPAPTRDPNRLMVIARLERVKRVEDAIRAFPQVVAEVPGAKLGIYGDGRLRQDHQTLINELGIASSVTLHGHRPDAREQLWECSGLLLTSRSEGFPLATLESFARACPVVSYDIKYGPREQVEEGVTGYLAPPGDVEALAAQAVKVLSSPERVARMGEAGQERVRHDLDVYVERWAEILQKALRNRPRRVRLDDVDISVMRLGAQARRGLRRSSTIEFEGNLKILADSPQSTCADAVLELQAVDDVDGAIVSLPLHTAVSGDGEVTLSSSFDADEVRDLLPRRRASARLRLRLAWENSYWETTLHQCDPGQREFRISPSYSWLTAASRRRMRSS